MKKDDDLNRLAARYLDLYQDQVSALAQDQRASDYFGLWRQWWEDAASATEANTSEYGSEQTPSGSASPAPVITDAPSGAASGPASGPASPAPASDDSGDDMADLRDRINQLERKLAQLSATADETTKRSPGRPKKGR